LSCGRSRTVYVLIAVNAVPSRHSRYICGFPNRVSGKLVLSGAFVQTCYTKRAVLRVLVQLYNQMSVVVKLLILSRRKKRDFQLQTLHFRQKDWESGCPLLKEFSKVSRSLNVELRLRHKRIQTDERTETRPFIRCVCQGRPSYWWTKRDAS